jgi:hypothetical protein
MEALILLSTLAALFIAADFSPLETGYNHNFEDVTQENQQQREKS